MSAKTHSERVMNKNFYGVEPKVLNNRALNWYCYNADLADAVEWLYKYLECQGYDSKFISKVRKIKDYDIGMTYCALARMSNNGIDIGDYHSKIMKRVNDCLTKNVNKSSTIDTVVKVDKQFEKANEIIAELEEELDNVDINSVRPIEFYKAFKINNKIAEYIIAKYTPLLLELDQVLLEDGDKELKTSYRHLTTDQLENRFDYVAQIIEDVHEAINDKQAKVIRKPRKKKVKSPEQLTKNVQYCEEFKDLNIKSINPVNIIKASSVWVYNTKYRTLGVYHAKDSGLSVKGTTIIDFDENTSISKKLRKPESIIPGVINEGKIYLRKIMGTIKTTETKLTGRLNGDTVILRALK